MTTFGNQFRSFVYQNQEQQKFKSYLSFHKTKNVHDSEFRAYALIKMYKSDKKIENSSKKVEKLVIGVIKMVIKTEW